MDELIRLRLLDYSWKDCSTILGVSVYRLKKYADEVYWEERYERSKILASGAKGGTVAGDEEEMVQNTKREM